MAALKTFRFDLDFDDPKHNINISEVDEKPADLEMDIQTIEPEPETYSEADIEIARQSGFESGKEVATREAQENLEVKISFYNDSPIAVDLPNQINCKIKTTDVALKGQTVSSSYKPAILDNGLNIQVPPFIESGDSIIVDTRSLEYVKKI